MPKDATNEIMKLPGPAQIIEILDVPEYFKALAAQKEQKEKVQKEKDNG